MKNIILKRITTLVFMSVFIMGTVLVAEAQMGQRMFGGQSGQTYDENGEFFGPGMMGRQGMMPGMGMMGRQGMIPGMGMMTGLLDFLPDLTEKQRNDIRAKQRQIRREHADLMLDIMDIRDDISQALAEERPDPARVRGLQESISQKQAEMLESSITHRNEIYDMLSEEQKQQLREYQQRSFERQYGPRW